MPSIFFVSFVASVVAFIAQVTVACVAWYKLRDPKAGLLSAPEPETRELQSGGPYRSALGAAADDRRSLAEKVTALEASVNQLQIHASNLLRLGLICVHTGPRHTCPACGGASHHAQWLTGPVTKPKFCGLTIRLFVRFFPWPVRCKEPGEHLHQSCKFCGAKWLCSVKG